MMAMSPVNVVARGTGRRIDGSGDERVGAALSWLADHELENLGTEVRLARGGGNEYVSIVVDGDRVSAVSVAGGGLVHLSAADEQSAVVALDHALALSSSAVKIFASGVVKPWIRPRLGTLAREHDLFAFACATPPPLADARWAEPADIPRLLEYEQLYNRERLTTSRADWHELVDSSGVAVRDVPEQAVISV